MKHETEILEALRKRFGDGYEVKLYNATKTNNQIREGVMIRQESENIGVCIYFKDILAELETETTEVFMKAMVDKIFSKYIENHDKAPKFDVRSMAKEQILQKIMPQAVSRERNEELLKNAPHKELLNIAIIYRYVLEVNDDNMMSFVVTNSAAKQWDISLQELDIAAKQYVKQENPYCIATMDSLINGLREECGIEEASSECTECLPIYVISNRRMQYGAAVLAEPEVLGDLAHKLQSDLIVLPSSVHELIVIPASGNGDDIKYFRQMVATVNEQEVSPEEILSTSVYRYKRNSGILEIA